MVNQLSVPKATAVSASAGSLLEMQIESQTTNQNLWRRGLGTWVLTSLPTDPYAS